MKKTKIICSIGPASCDPSVMSEMVKVGMNVARINFSHATLEERKNVVDSVKAVREITKQQVAILYDTKGPEFRSGMLENDQITLVDGKFIKVVKENILGTEEKISVNHPHAIDALKVGDVILLENDLMRIEVTETDEEGATCKIINGGILGNKKSLCAPGVDLNIPFISEIDKEDIIYACKNEGDFIALSFVSKANDVKEAREICKANGREDIRLVSKIENLTAIDNLDEIIEESDAIMIARGDLGVEAPLEKLPLYQKMIIEKCRKANKAVIVATEMLESMKKSSRPTRAEVSDVANAVLNGTDAVMLSGETTVGKYPVDTVRYMADICETTEQALNYSTALLNSNKDIVGAIATSTVSTSNLLECSAIIATTSTGSSARKISNLRPKSIILAPCVTEEVARSLALNFGIYTVVTKEYSNTDEIIADAKLKAIEFGIKKEDLVIITGSFPNVSKTNFMKVERI